MLLAVPQSPIPFLAALAVGCAAVVLGVALVLAGRRDGRVLLALIAAGSAAAASPWIALLIRFDGVWLVGAASAVAAGLLAFLLGRVLWTVLLAGVLGAAGLIGYAMASGPAAAATPPWIAESFADWSQALWYFGDWLVRWGEALWTVNHVFVVLTAGIPAAAVLVLGLLWRDGTLILSTALLGAIAVVGGAALVVWSANANAAAAWLGHSYVPFIAAGVLGMFGLIVQGRSKYRQWAQAQQEERESESAARRPE